MIENSAAVDLALGRSSVRHRILALLIEDASGRLHLREIQRRADTSPGTASRELAKLVAAGLIEREAEGNQVYFKASTSPVATMLRSLLLAMPQAETGPRPPRLQRAKPSAVATAAPASPTAAAIAAPTSATIATGDRTAVSTEPDLLGLQIARSLSESLSALYGERLQGVYLYGIRAAGAAAADADVETVVVLDQVDHYGQELEKTSHVCASLSRDFRILVGRVFVSAAAWNGDPTGSLRQIRSEAVAV
jgi:DNA-binding transcriptional ArsR family regulator